MSDVLPLPKPSMPLLPLMRFLPMRLIVRPSGPFVWACPLGETELSVKDGVGAGGAVTVLGDEVDAGEAVDEVDDVDEVDAVVCDAAS